MLAENEWKTCSKHLSKSSQPTENNDFACEHANETVEQFRRRMEKVAEHMNSASFGTGGGLGSLAKQLRPRCEELVRVAGERLPK